MFHIGTLRKITLTALAALVLASSPATARAGMLASGYLSSGNAYRLSCRVTNFGSEPVTISSARVLLDTGLPFTDYQDCTQQLLEPGKSCTFTGPGAVMAGLVHVAGGTKHLRGVCELLGQGNNLIGATDLR